MKVVWYQQQISRIQNFQNKNKSQDGKKNYQDKIISLAIVNVFISSATTSH